MQAKSLGPNILLLSTGAKVALTKIALEAAKITGATLHASDSHRELPTRIFADRFTIFELYNADIWIHSIIEYCSQEHISLVIPTRHSELVTLASHRDQFESNGIAIALSSSDILKTCINKLNTDSFFKRHEINSPTTQTLEMWKAAPLYPIICKPKSGSGSTAIKILQDSNAIPPTDSDTIVQTIAKGQEYTVNAYVNRDGECVCAIPHKRIHISEGEVMQATTSRIPKLIEGTKQIIQSLPGLYGPINIQAFYDEETDDCEFIEINPRLGGGFPLAHQAGGKFLHWLCQEHFQNQSVQLNESWTENLTMMRYRDAIFTHS